MVGLQIGSRGQTGTPISFVLAWQARHAVSMRPADVTETTMRRYEMPSVVDIAKRHGSVDQLSRMLDI